jgi:hypothetical protein
LRIAPSQSSGVGRSPAERRHGAGSRAASHQARPPAVMSWREPHPLGVCGLPTPGAQRGAHVPRACPALACMSAHCARRAGRCRPQPPEVHMTSADMPGTCWRLRDLDMSRTLRWHVHSRRWLLFGTSRHVGALGAPSRQAQATASRVLTCPAYSGPCATWTRVSRSVATSCCCVHTSSHCAHTSGWTITAAPLVLPEAESAPMGFPETLSAGAVGPASWRSPVRV